MSNLTEVRVRRFQSLEKADVALGGLTVIVGPSNSGKSAFGRALRALARNTAGSGHVTHGAKTALVAAKTEDGLTILLERGAGHSTYKTVNHVGQEENYTKSGTNVPDDIKQLLAMPEGDPDAHFTTQFDGPFLLNANGSTAQRILGELTNVTVLASASQEANRRRLAALREATIRRKDSAQAVADVKARYADLPKRKAAVDEARKLFDETQDTSALADRLEHLAETALTAGKASKLTRAKSYALKAALLDVEDELSFLTELNEHATQLSSLAERVAKAKKVASAQRSAAAEEGARAEECEKQLTDRLAELGLCPLCGHETKSA